MIIKSLVLNNFRVFRGVHEIDLEPRKANSFQTKAAPIVLFGGLNGAGKTSILTAVRVALYGRTAFGRGLSSADYQGQLDALIHKGVDLSEGKTSIELLFTHSQNGMENEYRVIRSWKRGHKDKLLLVQDGKELSNMSHDQCQSFLNELVPTGISELFFFDGEKIAELAEDESGEVLQTAVRRLLGIDVVERLRNDLAIYLKRHDVSAMPDSIKSQVEKLEKEHQEAAQKADLATSKVTRSREKVDRIDAEIHKVEQELSARGGAWAKSREQEQQRQMELEGERKELEKALRSEMDGSLPLALAPKAMAKLLEQLETEKALKQKLTFQKELDSFLTQLKAKTVDSTIVNAARALAAEQAEELDTSKIQLDLSDREYNQLQAQVTAIAKGSFERFDAARKRLVEVGEQIAELSINISRAPEEEQIQGQLAQLKELNAKRAKVLLEHQAQTEAAKKQYRVAIDLARKVQRLHEKHKVASNAESSVVNARKTQAMLSQFTESLTEIRVKQLELAFIKSYQKLARKEDLQLSARINTDTFDVELIDEHKRVINRKALSAGEKQIYAISILEALAKTSGKNLPIIIDTPLGRLDSKHRDKLIEHYFPEASHQVIILSTDTEIDETYFGDGYLKDDISHAFEIQFDAATKSSKLREGYFWQHDNGAAVGAN
ncbi:DNA sulfur modification protein DndD [Ferrimonas balearica]|uniref:DNA sulfur modification protein DndD n=1 Tax=Ferrimonas balearica TaxID=44012 RepID=UPI001C96F15E|nr:DNA sulfur modification protein DndD [Ferrimonas balearica]MBY5980540.1 DNA sulfur modification protein DndD [Ferrimonas balearica]